MHNFYFKSQVKSNIFFTKKERKKDARFVKETLDSLRGCSHITSALTQGGRGKRKDDERLWSHLGGRGRAKDDNFPQK